MKPIVRAGRMKPVHSDIRGPLFVEAMKRQKQGIDILKLNTGNPATFGFGLPDSIKNALMDTCRTVSATVTSKECLRQDRQSVIMRPVKVSKVSHQMMYSSVTVSAKWYLSP